MFLRALIASLYWVLLLQLMSGKRDEFECGVNYTLSKIILSRWAYRTQKGASILGATFAFFIRLSSNLAGWQKNIVFLKILCFLFFNFNGFWQENDVTRLIAKLNFYVSCEMTFCKYWFVRFLILIVIVTVRRYCRSTIPVLNKQKVNE